MSDSLQPCGLQHAKLPCPSLFPRVCSKSSPLSPLCHPTISSSVTPFSLCFQSFPASGSFPMCWLFASDGQSIGASASASVHPVNIQTLLINPGYTPRAANRCGPDVSGSAFNLPHTFIPSLLPTLNFQSSALLAQFCPQPTLGLGTLPWSF